CRVLLSPPPILLIILILSKFPCLPPCISCFHVFLLNSQKIPTMPATASRLAIFQESVIREMTRLANQHGAINLAQGFPDFDPPDALVEALIKASRGPHHQYSITWGAARFRHALAAKI